MTNSSNLSNLSIYLFYFYLPGGVFVLWPATLQTRSCHIFCQERCFRCRGGAGLRLPVGRFVGKTRCTGASEARFVGKTRCSGASVVAEFQNTRVLPLKMRLANHVCLRIKMASEMT